MTCDPRLVADRQRVEQRHLTGDVGRLLGEAGTSGARGSPAPPRAAARRWPEPRLHQALRLGAPPLDQVARLEAGHVGLLEEVEHQL